MTVTFDEHVALAKAEMARYLSGDRSVRRADAYGTPSFMEELYACPDPLPAELRQTFEHDDPETYGDAVVVLDRVNRAGRQYR